MGTFHALLALWEGNSRVTGEFSPQRPLTRSFGVLFDLRLTKRLSKPSRRRWFETPSRSLRRQFNVQLNSLYSYFSHRLSPQPKKSAYVNIHSLKLDTRQMLWFSYITSNSASQRCYSSDNCIYVYIHEVSLYIKYAAIHIWWDSDRRVWFILHVNTPFHLTCT